MKRSKNIRDNEEAAEEERGLIVPKPEMLLDSYLSHPVRNNDNVASSSGTSLRSSFMAMGFSPSLVDLVIQQYGEDDADLLLETLIKFSDSDHHRPDPSKNDPANLFLVQPKEELDAFDEEELRENDKRSSLLAMNFSVKEVDSAILKLGENASIAEMVDFITAAQIAENLDPETNDTDDVCIVEMEKKEELDNETLFDTMDKTIRLLELGFMENEVSLAIDRLGSDASVQELAECICADQAGDVYIRKEKPRKFNMNHSHGSVGTANISPLGAVKIEPEELGQGLVPRSRDVSMEDSCERKKPKLEQTEELSWNIGDIEEDYKNLGLKQEYTNDLLTPYLQQTRVDDQFKNTGYGIPRQFKASSSKSIDRMVCKPPYFFYGNVTGLSYDTWRKISKFLYAIEPEFVNTQSFSALNRREGYMHNLPIENRVPIVPKSPMTIEDAIPLSKKFWPSWDTRKKLNSISFDFIAASQISEKLNRILTDSRGMLSRDQKKYILQHCQIQNLMWVGLFKLSPIEVDHLELILGYPVNHTQVPECSVVERYNLLKQSFQVDALGYQLSVLKSLYPKGVTMLSIFSSIGGAEVALHRLGIELKGVVSVEASETKRRIMRTWWENSGQSGDLEQIEGIQKLTTNRIESLVEKFGGFDLIVCENSFCSSSPTNNPKGGSNDVFDLTTFHEFVRVLQRVRSAMERRK